MSIQSSNITSGFIDLATYDELEKYMYGCGDAVAYFVRTTCKSTWFTQVRLFSRTPLVNPSLAKAGRSAFLVLVITCFRPGFASVSNKSGLPLPLALSNSHAFAGRVI